MHYRRCRFLQENKHLYALYMHERFRYKSGCVKYGCDIPCHSKIGAGLKIDHPVGIVFNSSSVIYAGVPTKSSGDINAFIENAKQSPHKFDIKELSKKEKMKIINNI